MDAKRSSNPPPHVAILSSPGAGHLTPLLNLGRRLHRHHNLSVTIITHSDFPPSPSVLSSLPAGFSVQTLPSIPLSHLPPDARVETRLSTLLSLSAPHVERTLLALKQSTNLVAYITDMFCTDTLTAAKALDVPGYIFFTSNLFLLSFILHLPTLHQTASCEFRDMPEPLRLPGCVPLWGKDFIDPVQDRSDQAYEWILHMSKGFKEVDGMFVNSFEALEPDAAKIFGTTKNQDGLPPVRLIGPVWRGSTGENDGSGCLKWLDRQPRGSVLFVSFGSGGTLSCQQTRELALGLKESKQRFVWVIRTPSDSESSGAFFRVGNDSDPLDHLPEGFLSETRDSGLVIPNWAPQIEMLSHAAVGGFMTHCGWNSVMESLMNGVPMIAWPLYAEQRMNAVMLVEGVKVALRPEAGETGLVRHEEVREVVRKLMEGDKGKAARRQVEEIKEAGVKAWEEEEEEGSSYMALALVVNKWKSGCGV